MDPYIGEIRVVTFNYAPTGWLQCNGQLLAVQQYQALFALLGITYGGNGSTTFQLPNLQGRVPLHVGNLAGGHSYTLGQVAGSESVALNTTQLPTHTHALTGAGLQAGAVSADQASPVGNIPAQLVDPGTGSATPLYTTPANATGVSGGFTGQIGPTGGGQPVSILQPFLCLNFIIAVQGIYPSRP